MNAPGVGCGAAILHDGTLLLVKRRRAPARTHAPPHATPRTKSQMGVP